MSAQTQVQIGVCDVCLLVDGDDSAKTVSFCSFCQSWICQRCSQNPIKRARAAGLRKLQQAQQLGRRIYQ